MGPTDYQPVPNSASEESSRLHPAYTIYLDTQSTVQTSHTSFKTTHRPHYDAARSRALEHVQDTTQEVLLCNPSGQVTEGTFTTPYFFREGQWVTPPVQVEDHGGQQGTTRRWALENHLCVEGSIDVKTVEVGERVWLSNGVRGFGWGRIATKG